MFPDPPQRQPRRMPMATSPLPAPRAGEPQGQSQWGPWRLPATAPTGRPGPWASPPEAPPHPAPISPELSTSSEVPDAQAILSPCKDWLRASADQNNPGIKSWVPLMTPLPPEPHGAVQLCGRQRRAQRAYVLRIQTHGLIHPLWRLIGRLEWSHQDTEPWPRYGRPARKDGTVKGAQGPREAQTNCPPFSVSR